MSSENGDDRAHHVEQGEADEPPVVADLVALCEDEAATDSDDCTRWFRIMPMVTRPMIYRRKPMVLSKPLKHAQIGITDMGIGMTSNAREACRRWSIVGDVAP